MANLNQQLAIVSMVAIGLLGCGSGESSVSNPAQADGTAAIAQSAAPIINAKRTVALSSLAADILYQLDPEKLVGVAHDRSVAAHDELSQYPNIGDGREFDIKAIVDLRPDLVVGIDGVHERVLTQLEEAGVATQRYTLDSWDGLFTTIEDLARATSTDPEPLLDRYAALRSDDLSGKSGGKSGGKSQDESANEGEAIVTNDEPSDEENNGQNEGAIADTPNKTAPTKGSDANTGNTANELDDADKPDEAASGAEGDAATDATSNGANRDTSDSGETDRGSTLILASRDPLFSLNRNSWGGSAIEPFTQNIAADIDENRSAAGYVTLDPETIAEANPDTILIVEIPGSESSAATLAEFESLPFWDDLEAVNNDRVFLVDYYGLVKPATLADIDLALKQLADIFELPHRTARQLFRNHSRAITRRSTQVS